MCALGYYLEREGIATTSISLVRENAASMQPPRTLWVTFPLGRPLGRPNEPDFQHRVISAALDLFAHSTGPVLVDYLEDAGPTEVASANACPVAFIRSADQTWSSRLLAELATVQPWYELGRRRREGRTLVGASGSPIADNLARLGDYLDQEALPVAELEWFKLAIEDAKAFYLEALTAQPGDHDPGRLYQTLWHETELGAALGEFYAGFGRHPKLSAMTRIILPREATEPSP